MIAMGLRLSLFIVTYENVAVNSFSPPSFEFEMVWALCRREKGLLLAGQ
jgi:hypothetical protein